MLNERTEKTKGVIHLMVTSLCLRNCKYCCNKQYDLSDIPKVTDEELREAHTICITGGEPVAFTDPDRTAIWLKTNYPNIKYVYVYANAFELDRYLARKNSHGLTCAIDGYSISIKGTADRSAFNNSLAWSPYLRSMHSNVVYVFNDFDLAISESDYFKIVKRDWQEEFVPADDSIFRRI